MDNLIFFTHNNIFSSLVVVVIFIILLICLYIILRKIIRDNVSNKIEEFYLSIKKEIKYSVSPKFLELSSSVNKLVELAIEIWRMEQRIIKMSDNISEGQKRGLENSIQKMKRYLENYDIEIIDYTNQKYNEGFNLDILSVEKNSSIPEPIVKETIEPTITCKGQVVRKAKIILLNK